MKINILKVMFSALLMLFLIGCGNDKPTLVSSDSVSINASDAPEEVTGADDSAENSKVSYVYVHISGAVNMPGVYELESGSRLYDAVELAGGFREDAKEDYLNLAGLLEDGTQYIVPTKQEAAMMAVSQETAAPMSHYDKDGKLDINLATKDELMKLSGIGETRAQAIISYRDGGGVFDSPESIMNVSGIKEATYNSIKDQITANGG